MSIYVFVLGYLTPLTEVQLDSSVEWGFFYGSAFCVFFKMHLAENDDTRRTDDVFTGGDNGKRRTPSFHSSAALDVTLHLFISSLNARIKRGRGWGAVVARVWSWNYIK